MNTTKANKRFLILDSFRGIASLMVLFHHVFKLNTDSFKQKLSFWTYDICYFISSLNQIAVLFFFILSGFSIGLSLKRKTILNRENINEYFYRRFKRILPIYILSLLLAFIGGALTYSLGLRDYSITNLLGNLAFLQTSAYGTPAWFVPYGENGPLWSLAFEFFFYLIFPIAYIVNVLFLKKMQGALTKLALLLFLSIIALVLNKHLFVPYFLFFSLFIVWILGYKSSQCFIFDKSEDLLFFVCFLLGVTIVILRNRIPSNVIFMISEGFIINAIFYFMIVKNLYNIGSKDYFFVRILNFIFLKIGKGSYAIYALHYPILLLFGYYKISVAFQLLILLFFIITCILIEEVTIKWKLSFLKLNYFPRPKLNRS